VSLTRFRLYTHYVTPTFAKLNLLGILHVVHLAKSALTLGVEALGYNYAVIVGANINQNRLLESLADVIQRERGNLLRTEGGRFVRYNGTQIHRVLLRGAAEDYGEQMAKRSQPWPMLTASNMGAILGEALHDRRKSGGQSPSLVLAPELGKYSTADVPYSSGYPSIYDSGKFSACTLLALIGWLCCTFSWRVSTGEGEERYLFAYPAPRTSLNYGEARMLYWLGLRFSMLSRPFAGLWYARPLSTLGLLALLSPVVKDVVSTVATLSKLELNIYTLEYRGGRTAVRDMSSIRLNIVERFPAELAGAMLARARELPRLVEYAPEFFELLGEYLVTGNDQTYTEALRELAPLVSSEQNVAGLVGFLLKHTRRGMQR